MRWGENTSKDKKRTFIEDTIEFDSDKLIF